MEPRISLITLGVADLARATRFYADCLGLPQLETPPSITFFELGTTWRRCGRLKAWQRMPVWRRKARASAALHWRTTCARRPRWMHC